MKLFPKIINVILHPVTITIPGVFLIVYKNTGSINDGFWWTFISLIFSAIVSLFVLYGVRKGFFTNLDVSNRRQRIILYPVIILVVILFSGFVYLVQGPKVLIEASLLIIASLIILDIINTKIKVSGHVGVVSAFVTGLVYAYGGISFFALALIPLVAWARIVEKRHTLQETIVGALSGIVLSLLAIFIVQLIK